MQRPLITIEQIDALLSTMGRRKTFTFYPLNSVEKVNQLKNKIAGFVPSDVFYKVAYTLVNKELPRADLDEMHWIMQHPSVVQLAIQLLAKQKTWGVAPSDDPSEYAKSIYTTFWFIQPDDMCSKKQQQESVVPSDNQETEPMNFVAYLHDIAALERRNKYIVSNKWAGIMQRYLNAGQVTFKEFTAFCAWVIDPDVDPNEHAVEAVHKFGDLCGLVRMAIITTATHSTVGKAAMVPSRHGHFQVDENIINALINRWESLVNTAGEPDVDKENDVDAILRMIAAATDERDLDDAKAAILEFDNLHGEYAFRNQVISIQPENDTPQVNFGVWAYMLGYMHGTRDHRQEVKEIK